MMFTHNWTKNCPFILIFKECFGWSIAKQFIEQGKRSNDNKNHMFGVFTNVNNAKF